ncbi:hypothetical protein [Paenibacillus pabuli]|uniref:hypothetical protein n=1 Tax=Paenibacillus pabuli TaxID=1472 RepID=UPI003CF8B430
MDGVAAPQWFADSADTPTGKGRMYPWRLPRESLSASAGPFHARRYNYVGGCGDGTAENVES